MDRGLSQRQVARRLCVNAWTLLNWELGKTSPGAKYLGRIAQFLGYYPFPVGDGLQGKLLATRQRLGLTQAGLASRLGVDSSTILRWEHGKGRPPLDLPRTLERLRE